MKDIFLFIINNRIVYVVGLLMSIFITSLVKTIMKQAYCSKKAKYDARRTSDNTLPEMPDFNADKYKWLFIAITFTLEALLVVLFEILYFKTTNAIYISVGSVLGGICANGLFHFTHGGYKLSVKTLVKIGVVVGKIYTFAKKQHTAYKEKKLTVATVVDDVGELATNIKSLDGMSHDELAKYLVVLSKGNLTEPAIRNLFGLK